MRTSSRRPLSIQSTLFLAFFLSVVACAILYKITPSFDIGLSATDYQAPILRQLSSSSSSSSSSSLSSFSNPKNGSRFNLPSLPPHIPAERGFIEDFVQLDSDLSKRINRVVPYSSKSHYQPLLRKPLVSSNSKRRPPSLSGHQSSNVADGRHQQQNVPIQFDGHGLPVFSSPQEYFFVIAILSAPQNFEERQACRDTWFQSIQWLTSNGLGDHQLELGGDSGDSLDLSSIRFYPAFLVGDLTVGGCSECTESFVRDVERRIQAEQSLYRDVMKISMNESYRNLPVKTAIAIDYFARRQDLLFRFLLKTDDDSFIRLDSAVRHLSQYLNDRFVYWGSVNRNVLVNRNPGHKWEEPKYANPRYPPYCLGSGYALSRSLVRALASLPNRTTYSVEDAGTGIWVQQVSGVTYAHLDESLFPLITTGTKSTFCVNDMIVRRHCHSPEIMHQLFNNYLDCRQICDCPEDESRRRSG